MHDPEEISTASANVNGHAYRPTDLKKKAIKAAPLFTLLPQIEYVIIPSSKFQRFIVDNDFHSTSIDITELVYFEPCIRTFMFSFGFC